MNEKLPKECRPTLVSLVGSAQGTQNPEWPEHIESVAEAPYLSSPGLASAVRDALLTRREAMQTDRDRAE